ncbi:hypothetical protein D3C75_925380 [compost metagenome]
MNTTREISGSGWNVSTGAPFVRSSSRCAGVICAVASRVSTRWSPEEDTISREITPPMLCATTTMSCDASALPVGSKCCSASCRIRRISSWLSAIGMLVG